MQITDFERHLIDERSLFGQLRSDIAKLFKRSMGDKENALAREKYLEVDKMLGASSQYYFFFLFFWFTFIPAPPVTDCSRARGQ